MEEEELIYDKDDDNGGNFENDNVTLMLKINCDTVGANVDKT